jgi:CHAT domain-containing protein/tetratricopeptide (TPR) repeat protein
MNRAFRSIAHPMRDRPAGKQSNREVVCSVFIMTWFGHDVSRGPIALKSRAFRFQRRQQGFFLLSLLLAAACAGAEPRAVPPDQSMLPGTGGAGTLLVAGQSLTVNLAPGESRTFDFSAHSGRYSEIQVRQIQGMVESTLLPPAGKSSIPTRNDGGAGSVDRVPVLARSTGRYEVRVRSRERHAPVTCSVTLSIEHDATPSDVAITHAEELLAQAEWERRKPDSAGDSSPIAVLALYDQARRLAENAGDTRLERRSLIGKARYQIYRAGQYQEGVESATQATRISASLNDRDQQALAWKTLASAEAFVDQYDQSIDASQRAIAFYKSTGDVYWQGIVLGNLADIYHEIGETTQALDAAQSSLVIARQLSDDFGVAFTESTIGEIYQGSGQYQNALTAYDRALDTANSVSYPQVQGEVWSDLGQLYTQLNDWERAENAYRQALPILQKDGDGINEIEVLGHLGDLELHAGRPISARAYFTQALDRAQQQKLVREETFLWIGLARVCMQVPCPRTPSAMLAGPLEAARRIHQIDGEAAIENTLGDFLARRHQDAAAMQAYSASAELWRQIPNYGELAMTQARIAALEMRAGRWIAARTQIFQGLDAIERSRSQIENDALRTSYFSSKHSYYDLAVNLLMRLDQAAPGHGYAQEAWMVAERARARTLLDALAANAGDDAGPHEKARREAAALEVKIQSAEDQLSRLGSSAADVAAGDKLKQGIHSMLVQAAGLDAGIAPPAMADTSLSVADFSQNVLDGQTALLEYWASETHSYLWVIARDGMQSYVLPGRATLAAALGAYRNAMLARDNYAPGEDFTARQQRIAKADLRSHQESMRLTRILLPGHFSPRIHRLVIVADGDLLSLPFAGLEVHTPSAAAARSHYLLEKFDLVYEPSAATASALLRRTSQTLPSAQRIAIFADPVYGRDDARVIAGKPHVETVSAEQSIAGASSPRGAVWDGVSPLPRLPGTRREALAIAQIAGRENTSLYLGFDASPQTFEAMDWSSYAVAHLAAHAVVDTAHPELTGIVLSMVQRDGSPADGLLWLDTIYRSHVSVPLVTLSGCRTAEGKPIPGEGINSLARAFLYSGSRSVVGTLWNADDAGASELMQHFYDGFLNRHLSAPASLRMAQLAVLSDTTHRAPYYWAGFIAEGDWQRH